MDHIEFFEDVFEAQFCTYLLKDARDRLRDSREYQRSNFSWDEDIRRRSAPVLVRDYDEARRALILQQLTNRGVVRDDDYHVLGYVWTHLSYIPWHKDTKSAHAVTIYLNDVWDADWGGLFLYRDADERICGYTPRFNCGVSNWAHLRHSTTPVMLDAPEPRFTVQLFSRGMLENAEPAVA